ncbi:MAG: hypothetical protein KAK00_02125 [Nanoarchaeota archaeon]|nr:hypothetical protein [Nanoarchaeota archaeon]
MKKIGLIVIIGLLLIIGCSSNEKTHAEDELHDHSVEIEGSEMKQLSVQQAADLWEIDSEVLLNEIIEEFDFKGEYTTETVLEDMRLEYKFSPAIIKDIAEDIKQQGMQNE